MNSCYQTWTPVIEHFLLLKYSPVHKNLPKSRLEIHWNSVRFYEMGDSFEYWKANLLRRTIVLIQEFQELFFFTQINKVNQYYFVIFPPTSGSGLMELGANPNWHNLGISLWSSKSLGFRKKMDIYNNALITEHDYVIKGKLPKFSRKKDNDKGDVTSK